MAIHPIPNDDPDFYKKVKIGDSFLKYSNGEPLKHYVGLSCGYAFYNRQTGCIDIIKWDEVNNVTCTVNLSFDELQQIYNKLIE